MRQATAQLEHEVIRPRDHRHRICVSKDNIDIGYVSLNCESWFLIFGSEFSCIFIFGLYIIAYCGACLLFCILVAVGQGVDLCVVEQGMVPISPGEFLGADTQMLVWKELGSLVMGVMLRLLLHHVDVAQRHTGNGHQE